MCRRLRALLLLSGLAVALPASAAGVKLERGSANVKLALLLQGWFALEPGAAPSGNSLDTDFFLRRARLLMPGQLNETVQFFISLDSTDLGRRGDLDVDISLLDAWVEFVLDDGFIIDIGKLMVPFSHNGMQSAVSLHPLDRHDDLLRYPNGSHRGLRDFGVMIRGLLFDRFVEYRLAVLNGAHGNLDSVDREDAAAVGWSEPKDPRNPHDWPRFAARLAVNVFDADGDAGAGGFFYDGIYLAINDDGTVISPSTVFSFGVSADWQRDMNVIWEQYSVAATEGRERKVAKRSDYWAVSGDLFFDVGIDAEGEIGAAGQVNVYYYYHGSRSAMDHTDPVVTDRELAYYGGDPRMYTGIGVFGELGFRYDMYELMFGLDWFAALEADGGDSDRGDLLTVFGGLNLWWLAHDTNIKLQAGATQEDGSDWKLRIFIQAQLLF